MKSTYVNIIDAVNVDSSTFDYIIENQILEISKDSRNFYILRIYATDASLFEQLNEKLTEETLMNIIHVDGLVVSSDFDVKEETEKNFTELTKHYSNLVINEIPQSVTMDVFQIVFSRIIENYKNKISNLKFSSKLSREICKRAFDLAERTSELSEEEVQRFKHLSIVYSELYLDDNRSIDDDVDLILVAIIIISAKKTEHLISYALLLSSLYSKLNRKVTCKDYKEHYGGFITEEEGNLLYKEQQKVLTNWFASSYHAGNNVMH